MLMNVDDPRWVLLIPVLWFGVTALLWVVMLLHRARLKALHDIGLITDDRWEAHDAFLSVPFAVITMFWWAVGPMYVIYWFYTRPVQGMFIGRYAGEGW